MTIYYRKFKWFLSVTYRKTDKTSEVLQTSNKDILKWIRFMIWIMQKMIFRDFFYILKHIILHLFPDFNSLLQNCYGFMIELRFFLLQLVCKYTSKTLFLNHDYNFVLCHTVLYLRQYSFSDSCEISKGK